MKNLMNKLLRANVSVAQMAGFAIANLIGLAIVVLALQFYVDVRPVFNDEESFISRDYLIITQKVGGLGSLLGEKADFDANKIEDIKKQPWVRKVGEFTTSDYGIYAKVGMGGRELHTQFFFESIPTEFIDVKSDEWGFNPAKPEIPVIISKDYLALYNFGFAAAQGMPQISEGMIGAVPISFVLSGNGITEEYRGRIVGFSNRLNTIIVPQEFMEWSNSRFAPATKLAPSRLMVEVNNPGDPDIKKFMDKNGYEIAGDKQDSGKANYFLTVIISIVVAVGLLISLLSFFVLMLSIFLLLQKNARKLQDLLMLGYSPAQIAAPYIRLVIWVNVGVLIGAEILVLIVRSQYLPMLDVFGVEGAGIWWSTLGAIMIIGAITIANIIAIKKKMCSLWRD